jgi:predicted metal-binding membrane protein
MAQQSSALPRRQGGGGTTAALLAAGALAWVGTVTWAESRHMGAMPGTMGFGLPGFVAMWALMMAAMMLPSGWPFVGVYARTVQHDRALRLGALAAGYLLVWAATGVAAYALARAFGHLAAEHRTVARATAVGTFAAAGLYQLTPRKARCLSHCRSPLAHLFHYASFRGRLRDLRAGLYHGAFCLGCCWSLMLMLVAFGVMNVPAMIGLALVIALEKTWRHGERLARAVGVAALVYAAALLVAPSLAPGLDPGAVMPSGDAPMSMTG